METARDTSFSHSYIFVFIFGFAFAIFVSSFVFIQPLISLLIICVGLAALIDWKREVLILSIIFISFGLGAIRYSIKDFHEPIEPSSSGVVVSEPEDRENFRKFVMKADNGEKVLVSAPLYSPVQYGDKVEVEGTLEKPGIIKDANTGREFDYGNFLAKDDIYYILSFAEIDLISRGHGNSIKSALFKIKRAFVAKAKEILPEPHASLLTGLIVSGKEAMPKDILENFRRAGVIHIVVLSGYNITLIAEFLRKLIQNLFIFAKLPAIPQAAAGASIAGIILFVLMTGAEATVVRASIMALTVIVAQLFGRNYSASRALLVAGFLMLIENPKILVFDPSFQLSFLATLGLIYFMSPVDSKLTWLKYPKIREILGQTLSTQLMVLPLLIYMSGDFSLVSLPANILTLLVVPYTMLIGFLAVLLAFASAILASPLAFASHLLLSWILFVSEVLGNISFASITIGSVPIWVVLLAYVLIFLFVKNKLVWPKNILWRWENGRSPLNKEPQQG